MPAYPLKKQACPYNGKGYYYESPGAINSCEMYFVDILNSEALLKNFTSIIKKTLPVNIKNIKPIIRNKNSRSFIVRAKMDGEALNSKGIIYDERTVGIISYNASCEDKKNIYISLISVAQPFRHKKCGTKIIRSLILRENPYKLSLHVNINNMGGRKFFEQLGFVEIKITKKYFNRKDDGIYMEKYNF